MEKNKGDFHSTYICYFYGSQIRKEDVEITFLILTLSDPFLASLPLLYIFVTASK